MNNYIEIIIFVLLRIQFLIITKMICNVITFLFKKKFVYIIINYIIYKHNKCLYIRLYVYFILIYLPRKYKYHFFINIIY